MKIRTTHSWNVSPKEAIRIQKRLRRQMKLRPFTPKKRPMLIASADASFQAKTAIGAVVVMTYPALQVKETVVKRKRLTFPYVPTLLTFREGPVLCDCFRALKHTPDLIIFDGQGIAHPRAMGLATHMGILFGKPTIGCAKSRLCGNYAEPSRRKGHFSYLFDDRGNKIGAVVRTREAVKPVFVSPGNKIDIKDSIRFVLSCSKRFRIPEPLRMSHSLSKEEFKRTRE